MRSNSIQFKIITAIIAVLLVSIVASIIITTENQKRNLLSTARSTLSVNTEMLNQVIRSIMLSGEAEIATKTLQSIKGLEEFEEVEIYRSNGFVAFSDYNTVDFVNDFQNKVQFDYTDRSESMMIDNEAFQKVINSNTPFVRELTETGEMEYFFPILNYAECRACHGDENFIRGVSHFKISIKNIYDKVNFARIVLTAFFITIGIIIFIMLIYLLRRLVIKRVLAIGKAVSIVATGNLDVQIKMDSKDELGTLSNQINTMISSLKEKKQLEIENALIETSLKENQKYLKNIQEGLLLVDGNLIISENYSRYLIQMFETEEIAGRKLTEFLFSYSEESTNIRNDLEMFISLLFNNTTADMDMIKDINPLLDCWIQIGEKKILIDAFVQRIFDDENNVENVMIIFKDKTNIFYAEKELEEERKRSISELDHIATLLNVGPQTFLQFVNEAESVLGNFKKNLSRLNKKEFIEQSFREIHSLKGSAAYFNFQSIEKLSHNLENILSSVRKEGLKDNSAGQMKIILDELFKEFESIKALIERFKEFADIHNGTESIEKNELDIFFKSLEMMVYRLADEMEKKISVDFNSELTTLPHLGELKNSIIHLLRNSVDHGIEDPFERISLGKEEKAKISLKIKRTSENPVNIIVSDDGRGINYVKLEKTAREKGYLKGVDRADHKTLLNLLFQSGFSSKDEVTEVSGRGVGLDVVKDDVKNLGGTIGISSSLGKGTVFTIHLPTSGEQK